MKKKQQQQPDSNNYTKKKKCLRVLRNISTWIYANQVSKHFVISHNFPCFSLNGLESEISWDFDDLYLIGHEFCVISGSRGVKHE